MADFSKMGAAGGRMNGDMPPESAPAPAPESGEKNTVVLSADHFPDGMTPKEGDKLTFCVTGAPDSEGNVSGYFEPMGGAKDDEDEWVNDFKKSMSPAQPEAEAA